MKEAREQDNLTYGETKIRITSTSVHKTCKQEGVKWNILNVARKNHQPRIRYPNKLSFEKRNKDYLRQRLREFIANKLQEIFHREEKLYRSEI